METKTVGNVVLIVQVYHINALHVHSEEWLHFPNMFKQFDKFVLFVSLFA